MTPLHYAVIHDNAEVAELLLEAGADVNATNQVRCMIIAVSDVIPGLA